MTRATTTVSITLALTFFGGAGCVPVPGSRQPADGSMRPEKKIGRSSAKPLRLDHSSRERVVAVLGPPDEITLDGRTFTYPYRVVATWRVWLFPFGVTVLPEQHMRLLRLRFDARGTLESYNVYRDRGEFYNDVDRGRLVNYMSYRRSHGAADCEVPLPPLSEDDDANRAG